MADSAAQSFDAPWADSAPLYSRRREPPPQAIAPRVEHLFLSMGVRAQRIDKCLDALGAQAVQIQIHAELQELAAYLRVLAEQRFRGRRPILGQHGDEMFLLGVEVSKELGLERQPSGLELLEVAAIGA